MSAETSPVRRPEAPELIHRMPLCPLCEQEVWHDGNGFVCDQCSFSWSTISGDPGYPLNDDRRQCPSVNDAGHRCVLDEDHTTAIVTPYLAGRGRPGADKYGIAYNRDPIHAAVARGDRTERWSVTS